MDRYTLNVADAIDVVIVVVAVAVLPSSFARAEQLPKWAPPAVF